MARRRFRAQLTIGTTSILPYNIYKMSRRPLLISIPALCTGRTKQPGPTRRPKMGDPSSPLSSRRARCPRSKPRRTYLDSLFPYLVASRWNCAPRSFCYPATAIPYACHLLLLALTQKATGSSPIVCSVCSASATEMSIRLPRRST